MGWLERRRLTRALEERARAAGVSPYQLRGELWLQDPHYSRDADSHATEASARLERRYVEDTVTESRLRRGWIYRAADRVANARRKAKLRKSGRVVQ